MLAVAGRIGIDAALVEADGEPEDRATRGRVVDADGAAHQFHQLLRDRQAEAGAAVAARGRIVGLREGLEQARPRFARDADAGVVHLEAQHDRLGVLAGHAHPRQDAAFIGELDGIAEQVGHDLAQPVRVAADRHRDVVGDVEVEADPLAGRLRGIHVVDVVQQVPQVEIDVLDGQLAGLDLGKIEDVVDDHQEVLARALDQGGVVALGFGERGRQQHLGHPEHAVHRGADLVAHGGQECALGAARGFGGILGLFQLLGAHADLAFQLVAVVQQGGAAVLDLGHHGVEAVDQLPQLVGALVGDAQAVVLAGGDLLRGLDQLGHRLGDAALEAAGHAHRDPQRHQHRQAHHRQPGEDVDPGLDQVGLDHDHAHLQFARHHRQVQAHAARQQDLAPGIGGAQRLGIDAVQGLGRDQVFGRAVAGGQVEREGLAVAVVQDGRGDVALGRQRAKRIAGACAVAQQQVVGAAGRDDLGEGLQLHRLVLAMVRHRSRDKGCEHEQQCGRGREQRDDGQLLVQAGALEVRHSDPAGTSEQPGAGRRRASFAECKFPQEKNIRSRGWGSVDGRQCT